jgi:hypothetical protein
MSTLEIILTSICVLLAIVFIVVRVCKGGMIGLLMKTLASFGFVASAIIGMVVSDATGTTKWVIGLIALGLLCGMVGDIVLDLKVIYPNNDKFYLNSGMLSFFVGHIFYIVAFSLFANIQDETIWLPLVISAGCALVLTMGITLSSKKMGLDFGKFLIQTISYTFILTFAMSYTLVLSILGCNLWLAFVGMVLFFLSDVVLSFQYFGGKIADKKLIAINHALYYAAQIILVVVLCLTTNVSIIS